LISKKHLEPLKQEIGELKRSQVGLEIPLAPTLELKERPPGTLHLKSASDKPAGAASRENPRIETPIWFLVSILQQMLRGPETKLS